MPFRQSIAIKIFGLAVLLLLLTICLAGYLLFEAKRTEREMHAVAALHLPLANSIARINENGLRRRLAFERWFGALNADRPNADVVSEARANYALFTGKLTEEFATARRLLDSHPLSGTGRDPMAELRTRLEHVEAAYPAMSRRQMQLIELQLAGEHARANELLNVLNDQQRTVLMQREVIGTRVAAMTQAAADGVAERQRHVEWLTIALTVSTVLLGLVLAGVITLRLTRPVRALVTAIRDVQDGKLELQLPVQSRDEVGALTDSFNFFVQELRAKERIKRTFGKYIDPRVLEQVLQQPEAANVAGERRVVTVVFADLVGFTGLSERLTPSLMVTLLNRHFGLQAQAVQEHHGVVDKFIGDAVMAFWGPPFVKAEDHAVLACRAALAQRAALEVLRRELSEITGLRRDVPEIDLRVGICSGEVVVGNIGSENTRSYTVIGDTVNLASRIEGANRVYGTQVLLGEATAQALGGEFELREIDAIAAKGKSEPSRVYELLGRVGSVSAQRLQLRERYEQALAAYRRQDWDAAAGHFEACAQLDRQDRATVLMIERVGTLRANPPGAGWDGVWRLAEK